MIGERTAPSTSGGRDHDVDARRNPELTPSLQPVSDPDGDGENDERAEHHEAERADEMTKDGVERVSEEIAGGDEARRPQSGGEEIQRQKALPANGAQPHSERREIAHTVDKTEGQDETGVVPLQPAQRFFDAVPPSRKSVQYPDTEMPTDPKIKLITGEAAKPSSHEQQYRVEQTLRRRKADKQDDRLAFEEGPDERDQVGICAVFSDQLINVHSQPFPAPSWFREQLLEGAARRPSHGTARMLSFSGTPVERDSRAAFDFPSRRRWHRPGAREEARR